MVTIIGVKFRYSQSIYYYDPCGAKVAKGDSVILETARGIEYAEVALGNTQVEKKDIVAQLKPILRVATQEDMDTHKAIQLKNKEVFKSALSQIEKNAINMRLIATEYTHDLAKLVIYYSSTARVDFRELVKDLATIFKTRIEMRQINDRDEYKMLGGMGVCGRECCCVKNIATMDNRANFKMAKNQGLSPNPMKNMGMCGKTKCCIAYENSFYQDINRLCPKIGGKCCLKDGRCGKLEKIHHLKEQISVKLEKGDTVEFITVPLEQLALNNEISPNEELE